MINSPERSQGELISCIWVSKNLSVILTESQRKTLQITQSLVALKVKHL